MSRPASPHHKDEESSRDATPSTQCRRVFPTEDVRDKIDFHALGKITGISRHVTVAAFAQARSDCRETTGG
jgi:hypothetical protein